MSWYPIAFLPPQIENSSGMPYAGAVLKAYAAGTNNNIPMATDYTGVTTANSMVLNASGYPTLGGAIVIPHLQQNYKLALYPDQAAADANSGAIYSPDNIQIAPAANSAFVQYFDGDGVNPTFTLSQNFGTDENILMVFSDRALQNYVTNSDFATDTIWTKGAGWTIGSGVATAAGAISTAISQIANSPIIQGQSYTVEFTVTASAGTLTPSIGGNPGTTRGAGTWRETIVAGATQVLAFTGVGFTGTLDNASIKSIGVVPREINRPDEYTLVGNQLTLNNIPPVGTKNVIVFAPSQLLGAANNAAAAAATSEANALAYANSASASATNAAASYDSFDDRYLGAKAADPVLDNDGNALIDGALYWNSVGSVMKVYALATTTWQVAYTPAAGTLVAANNLSDVPNKPTALINLGAAAASLLAKVQDFRLTLTTGLAVTTTDVTGAGVIYCTPYKGNGIALYDGTNWNIRLSAQFSLALAALTVGRPYDVFCYDNAGVPTLEFTAWTNDTTRATGLVYQDGILVKAGALTRRYLGTFYTTAAATTEDSILKRYLFNYYNRAYRSMAVKDAAANWAYSTNAFRQANGSAANQVSFIRGVSEDAVSAMVQGAGYNTAGSIFIYRQGIGLDSTTVDSSTLSNPCQTPNSTGSVWGMAMAHYRGTPAAGKHDLVWLEGADGVANSFFIGTSVNGWKCGLTAEVWA